MARRAYRQDVGMVLKKTRLGGFFVLRGKVYIPLERGLPAKPFFKFGNWRMYQPLRGQASLLQVSTCLQQEHNQLTIQCQCK